MQANTGSGGGAKFDDAYVRAVAKLSRLALSEAEVEEYRVKLAATVEYVDRLAEIDLQGVEPLVAIGDEVNRFRDDVPGAMLSNEALMKMAPQTDPPFVRVPKVLGGDES